jgi:hypothetical protein
LVVSILSLLRLPRVVVSDPLQNPSGSDRVAMFGYHKPPDLEVGLGVSTTLYPAITESPDLRWTFVRKIYVILAVQLAIS